MTWGLASLFGGGLLLYCGLTCHELVPALQGKLEKSPDCSTFGDIAAIGLTAWLTKLLTAAGLAKLLQKIPGRGGKVTAPEEPTAPAEPAPAEPVPPAEIPVLP